VAASCAIFSVVLLWYVASSPDIPVRCVIAGETRGDGLSVRIGPSEGEYFGKEAPQAGDLLLALNGHPIHSFADYAKIQSELRNPTLAIGSQLPIATNPDELSPESDIRFVELYTGERYVHSIFHLKERGPQTIWLKVSPQPLAALAWSVIWFLLQLPIVVLTGLAYWRRPEDRAVKLFFIVSALTLAAYTGGNHWWVLAGAPVLVMPFVAAAVLLPATLLHFFLVYPSPSEFLTRWRGWAMTAIYSIPLAALFGAAILVAGGSLLSIDYGDGPLANGIEQSLGSLAVQLMETLRLGIYLYLSIAALFFLASLICLIRSFLHARNLMERAQVQGILWAGLGATIPILYTLHLAYFRTTDFAFGAARAPMALASALFMIAYAVGIARHKLMLVDQVLSRGMWYYVLSSAVACGSSLAIAVGAMSVLRREGGSFSPSLMLAFVLTVSILMTGWLRDRLQRSIDRRFFREKYPLDKALQRINRAVTHVLERQAVAENLLSSCCEALRVDRAALYLQGADRQRFRLAAMIGRMDVPIQFQADNAILQALIEETAVQRVVGGASPVQEWLREFSAELIQGLESDGDVVGLVMLGAKANGAAYTAEDVTFITAIGRVTGVALHCAKVHEDINRLNEDLQQKTQLVSEQARRIAFLQAELASDEPTADGTSPEDSPEDFRRDAIKGHSPAIQGVLETVRKVAASDASVLLRGESGTGKELLALAIHDNSPRRDGPLVNVHCAALSPALLESELFGHVRGAFTDAREARMGRFQLAHGGTLFLDEIGDVSLETQVKLLRVLQERVIEPVGGTQSIPVDVRVVAATHQNLEQRIAEGRFREDLYYRLNVITITLPPLRERRDDLFELSLHFLRRACARTGKRLDSIDDEALSLLAAHSWPGNIRELQNVLERAVVLAEGHSITADDLPNELRSDFEPQPIRARIEQERPRRRALTADVLAVPRRVLAAGSDDEREMLAAALKRCGGNKADAARMLGMPRSTYYSKLKKHGIE
jgi:transcriptional regulator with GAF, ATPase, and Fis domain